MSGSEQDAWAEDPEASIPGLRLEGTRLWYRDKAYVKAQDQETLICDIYQSRLGGHMGIAKTAAKVKQHHNFPHLKERVKEVVDQYDLCGRSKPGRHKLYRLLQPLPVAERPQPSTRYLQPLAVEYSKAHPALLAQQHQHSTMPPTKVYILY